MSIFEGIMLTCFGLAWPVNIYKTLKAKSAKGRSFVFQIVVLIGYMSGVIHKILYSYDLVLILYCLNLLMISIDLALLVYYQKQYDLKE